MLSFRFIFPRMVLVDPILKKVRENKQNLVTYRYVRCYGNKYTIAGTQKRISAVFLEQELFQNFTR